MSGKELLLFCIVMMHVSFMASRPVDVEKFRESMKILGDLSVFCNLDKAEKSIIKYMFDGVSQTLEPIGGITFGNTTEEIQTSICAITDSLSIYLPTIIKPLISDNHTDNILSKTNTFLQHFKDTVKSVTIQSDQKPCNISFKTPDDYTMKVTGLRIIHSTKQWVESFTGKNISCV